MDADVMDGPDAGRPPSTATGLSPRRRAVRLGVPLLFAVVVALFVAFVSPRAGWHGEFDFKVYRGAVIWWFDGKPLYSFHRNVTPYGFTYPPFAALAMSPWGAVPQTAAMVVNASLSGLVVIGTTWWLVSPVAARHGWPRGFSVAVVVPLVYLMEPVRESLGYGNVNLYIAALVLFDVAALARGRSVAGVGIGLAAAVKLTPGLFILYLVLTGRWRAAGVAAGTFLGATLVAFAVAPGTSTLYWTHVVFETSRIGRIDSANNQSALGLASRIAGTGKLGTLLWLLLAATVLIVGMARARQAWRRGDDLVGVTLVGLTACLVSPVSWTHHLYWVVPAIVVLVDIAAGTPAAVVMPWRRGGFPVSRPVAGGAALVVAAVFGSSVLWVAAHLHEFHEAGGPLIVLGTNSYALLMLALVALLPVRPARRTVSLPGPGRGGARPGKPESRRPLGSAGPPT